MQLDKRTVAIVTGALYSLAFSLVIYLAKGGPKSGDARYVIPSGIITGGLIGLFTVIWAVNPVSQLDETFSYNSR